MVIYVIKQWPIRERAHLSLSYSLSPPPSLPYPTYFQFIFYQIFFIYANNNHLILLFEYANCTIYVANAN